MKLAIKRIIYSIVNWYLCYEFLKIETREEVRSIKSKKLLLFGTGFFLGVLFVLINALNASAHHSDKVTVCHKTDSNTNPWVEQTINANELQSHLANGDFLVNSDHPCPPVTPTPTVEDVSPSPTVGCGIDQDCITPTITTDPTATPSATDTPAPQGSAGSSGPIDDGLGCGHHSCAPAQSAPKAPPQTGRAE